MNSISLDDPEFFQKANAQRPDLFDQEKMAKYIAEEKERSYPSTSPNSKGDEELRQQLAAIEHEWWGHWQSWVHEVLREANPSPEIGDILERWDRQIETPYAELSDSEKASDIKQVDRYWRLILRDRAKHELEAKRQFAYFTRDNACIEDVCWLDERIAEITIQLEAINKEVI